MRDLVAGIGFRILLIQYLLKKSFKRSLKIIVTNLMQKKLYNGSG